MNRKSPENLKYVFRFAAILMSCALLFSACRREEEKVVVTNTAPEATVEEKRDDFQDNLKSVQTAGFNYIFAFRRPDGAAFAADDKKFLRENSPADTNQWLLTADEKAFVAGSNFRFMPEQIAALRTRFAVEDYSVVKPEAADGNTNRNSNAAIGNQNSGAKNTNQSANSRSTQGSFTDN